ncbi:MAG: hypothetical protein GY928_03945, partial [Colwellia sp.]|nr:hypothetical protein [Colwellia sp.]
MKRRSFLQLLGLGSSSIPIVVEAAKQKPALQVTSNQNITNNSITDQITREALQIFQSKMNGVNNCFTIEGVFKQSGSPNTIKIRRPIA